MRILAVTDQIDRGMTNPAVLRQRAGDAELLLSCGDLPSNYLDFIASALNRQLYYVHGNHCCRDPLTGEQIALFGINLHNRVVRAKGLFIGGLEGSMRYKPGPAQYADWQMWGQVLRMAPTLTLNRLIHGRAIDILITHAPPRGIHDRPDRTHQGFRAFLGFMRWFRPKYLLHGHIHVWDRREVTKTRYRDTWVLNVYPWRIVEIDPGERTKR
jgi:hypothetical protein